MKEDELQLAKDILFELEEYDYSEVEDETLIAILHTIKKVKEEELKEIINFIGKRYAWESRELIQELLKNFKEKK